MERMPRTLLFSLLVTTTLIAGSTDAAEVYRWVDENGEVHYSESLPPNFKEDGHDVLNSRGIVVEEDLSLTPPPIKKPTKEEAQELPRDKSGLPRPKAMHSAAELQRRMDNFLTLRYASEQEIVDAMNVEIKQLEYDRRLLNTTRNSTLESFEGRVRQAANMQRAGLEVGQEVSIEVNLMQSRLANTRISLDALDQRELTIRADFDKQLTRYRFLTEEWTKETETSGS